MIKKTYLEDYNTFWGELAVVLPWVLLLLAEGLVVVPEGVSVMAGWLMVVVLLLAGVLVVVSAWVLVMVLLLAGELVVDVPAGLL